VGRPLQHLIVASPAVRAVAPPASNIVQMAVSPAWLGHDLAFRGGGREILMLRSSSRVLAASLSDILCCRDHFDDPAWSIEVLQVGATRPSTHHVAVSLDSFLCQAVEAVSGPLPPHAAGRWILQDWPDLGAATRQVAALRVAAALRRGPATAAELAARTDLGLDEVTRYLWALRAAGLLQSATDDSAEPAAAIAAVESTAAAPAGGVLARLARRFGLGWK